MISGYYLSRFDQKAYDHLGGFTQSETHKRIGSLLGIPPNSIKNWRDEFDPIHENSRQGWHKRPMAPSRKRTVEALAHLSENELYNIVSVIINQPIGPLAEDVVNSIADVESIDDESSNTVFGTRGRTGHAAELEFRFFRGFSG